MLEIDLRNLCFMITGNNDNCYQRTFYYFPGGAVVKNPPAYAGYIRDACSIPGSGRSPGLGNGNPLQLSCLENPLERSVWQATVITSKSLT